MDDLLKETILLLQDSLVFLNKVKDKKIRKEKDELVSAISRHIQKMETVNKPFNKLLEKAFGNMEMYDDLTAEEVDAQVYDDVDIKSKPVIEPAIELPTIPCHSPTVSVDAFHDGLSVPCESLTDALYADFLEMKRDSSNPLKAGWQKRWCIIWNNIFFVYESSQDKKQKEAIQLQDFLIAFPEDKKESKRKGRCIELKHKSSSKIFECCANDVESAKKWKENLERASRTTTVDGHALQRLQVCETGTPISVRRSNTFKDRLSTKFKMMRKTASEGSSPQRGVTTPCNNDGEPMYDDTWLDANPEVEEEIMEDIADETYADVMGEQNRPAGKGDPPPLPEKPLAPVFPPSPTVTFPSSPLPPFPDISPVQQGHNPPPSNAGSSVASPCSPKHQRESPEKSPTPLKTKEDSSGAVDFSATFSLSSGILKKAKKALHTPELTEDFDFEEDENEYKNIMTSDLYQGMWDCLADEENELSFRRGQIIHIISKDYDADGWWIAKRRHQVGFVPKNYLMEAYAA